jgi:hypothetical protein
VLLGFTIGSAQYLIAVRKTAKLLNHLAMALGKFVKALVGVVPGRSLRLAYLVP